MAQDPPSESPSKRVRAYYDKNPESNRFDAPHGRLEFDRTKAILTCHPTRAPMDILDVGGGTGAYSFWLAEMGHRVTFVDLSDVHVRCVRERNETTAGRITSISKGTALDLSFPQGSFDVVLNMGPKYHLPAGDRQKELGQSGRVLREGGLLVTAYISRFAALMDGYKKDLVLDPVYVPLAIGDLKSGTHDSPDDGKCFTLAYMHRPEELRPELEAAGFRVVDVLAVEGLFWKYPHPGQYVQAQYQYARLLEYAELIEREPSVLGASPHLLAVSAREAR
jgi:2-polyprenyl-3-methyl-5-hydroxy-6-metoxy-1,4-benzoquinol methylase